MEKYKNKIFNQSCESLMDSMISDGFKVDLILTSPPYNTGRVSNSDAARKTREARYDFYLDNRTPEQYRDWCVELFDKFSKILKNNGVVLWNVSYGNDVTVNLSGFNVLWLVIADLIEKSDFCVADKITWKKKSAIPSNTSSNKLTRITEDVFVFCRKSEIKSFYANKKKVSESVCGQAIYENIYNLVEAANNDGANDLNKATFSSELVCKLLKIYAPSSNDTIVYDPFMGTGTTAFGAKSMGLSYVGSELSESQCEFAENRLAYGRQVKDDVDGKGKLF